MKKILATVFGLVMVFACVSTVSAAENWRLSGNYTITFTCTSGCGGSYVHTMSVLLYDNNDGTFSGTGYYNTSPSITWTVTGDVTGDTVGFLIDYDGSAYGVDADGTIAMDGTMSGSAVGPGQAFNWVMTPKATFYRYAEITSPAADSIVTDTLNLGAYLMDNDYDPVQWAVRSGTCTAATNTVMGNVDGFSNPFAWAVDAGDNYKYVFSATANVISWVEGTYCFIFNPSEDGGESDIRLTEFFKVNWDADNDGSYGDVDCNDNDATIYPGAPDAICNGIDNNCDGQVDEDYVPDESCFLPGVCAAGNIASSCVSGVETACSTGAPTTEICDGLDNDCDGQVDEGGICEYSCIGTPEIDTPDVALGTNRWKWDGNSWETVKPKGKGPTFIPTSEGTHYCGCEQILTWLHTNLPESYGEMNGHWKYGCSQSAIQDFMRLTEIADFTATASLYYNGPTDSASLYGSGPIVFTWNPATGHVTGGYYTEQVPANTGTLYYNMVTGGSVNGDDVELIFDRVNPYMYHFHFLGTLVGNTLSGMMDGPYWFTATGTVTP